MADFYALCNPVISPSESKKSMSDDPKETSKKDYTDVTMRLPNSLIDGVEALRKEWGLKSRGAVIERLLEDLFRQD